MAPRKFVSNRYTYGVPNFSQYGGTLPVYEGARNQRGGGILGSLKSMFFPIAKTLLNQGLKAAPGVINAIINKEATPGRALLRGLKTVGRNTMGELLQPSNTAPGPRRTRPATAKKRKHTTKRPSKKRKVRRRDIFSK